ncbi:MAG TPA: TetR/AcrR family transcriptional regulator C-terminal domain-containing protein [Sporichthyaceae bacterium]
MERTRRGRPALLTRDQIARAAFDLVDAEGGAALTMNRLAAELGVGAMTLYGYAESKDEIVNMLPDLLFADLPTTAPEQPPADALEDLHVAIYRRLVGHGEVTRLIANSPAFGRARAEILESVLARLAEAGFEPTEAFELQRALGTYTSGFAQLALAGPGGPGRPRARWIADLDPTAYPHTTQIADLLATPPNEDQFLHGLRRILGGESSAG